MSLRNITGRLVRRVARRQGLEVRRIRSHPKAEAALAAMPDEERLGYGEHEEAPVYLPWRVNEDFQRRYAKVSALTSLSKHHYWNLMQLARQQAGRGGDFAECGVYRGSTALLMAELMAEAGSPGTLHLFDSFAGLSTPDPANDLVWKAGDFGATAAAVRALLDDYIDRVRIHEGWIPDTFAALPPDAAFDFVHLDLDLYQPTRGALNFFIPRMNPGGLIVVDDYPYPWCRGVRAAAEESIADDFLRFYAATSQLVMIRR